MLSYWEQESFLCYDHVVVGAGIVGLSTAIELRVHFPTSRILVLERGLLPTGASSRNAGFACMGSVTELLDDLQHSSEEEVVRLFLLRKQGLERLRARLGDAQIGYEASGSYELIRTEDLPALDAIERLNALLWPHLGHAAFSIATSQLDAFGFSRDAVKALVANHCEGSIHTGRMLRALTDLAILSGIEIKTGAEVTGFQEEGHQVVVSVQDPFRRESLRLHAQSLCICTNAFARQLLPEEIVHPGRGQVLITEPVPGLRFKGIFHMDAGYYYFREVGGRVLFGGGRNLDFAGEETTEFGLTDRIQQELEHRLRHVILPEQNFTIAQRWSGIMAFGPTKRPIVRQFSPHVFGAFRMGGMGVAIGSQVAVDVAEMIAEQVHCQHPDG